MRFWTENWLGYIIADKVGIPLEDRANLTQNVSDFYLDSGWVLGEHFTEEYPQICADIIAIKIANSTKDILVWAAHKMGEVTTKAAYNFCRTNFPIVNWDLWIWAPFILPTRSTLLWRLIWGRLLTSDILASWGIAGPSICIFCRANSDSMDHIFTMCPFAASIIHKVADCFGTSIDVSFGFYDVFLQIMGKEVSSRTRKIWRIAWVTYFWMIWGAKNRAIHRNEKPHCCNFLNQLLVYI